MVAQQSENICPRRALEGVNIVVWELRHETGDVMQSILARLRAPEPMCEQVLGSLVWAAVSEKTLNYKVDYLQTSSAF